MASEKSNKVEETKVEETKTREVSPVAAATITLNKDYNGTLVIMRGLPGSGKSYFAARLTGKGADGKTVKASVFSADNFFMNGDKYEFDKDKLPEAHKDCQTKVEEAMKKNTPLVVVDNTNSRRWEYKVYAQFAETYKYNVVIYEIVMRNWATVYRMALRCSHDVPHSTYKSMSTRWQRDRESVLLEPVFGESDPALPTDEEEIHQKLKEAKFGGPMRKGPRGRGGARGRGGRGRGRGGARGRGGRGRRGRRGTKRGQSSETTPAEE
jgi:predicted kinase